MQTPDTFAVVRSLSFLSSYWWRVKATRDTIQSSPYSKAWKFTTALPLPGAVVLSSPAQNAVINRDSIRLTWLKAGPVVQQYWLEYGIDSSFTVKAIDSVLIDTTRIIVTSVKGLEYHWRVRARNLSGWGAFSPPRRFVRSTLGTDILLAGIPTRVVLEQNYPNPFNPNTTIRFGLPYRSHVTVTIVNTIGQIVAELVNGEMEAGYHEVRFDATSLSSGVYLCRMRVGVSVDTKKLMLVQ